MKIGNLDRFVEQIAIGFFLAIAAAPIYSFFISCALIIAALYCGIVGGCKLLDGGGTCGRWRRACGWGLVLLGLCLDFCGCFGRDLGWF